MTNQKCVISVDMGTSSVRSCLVDLSLSILHKSQFEVSLSTDKAGRAEQDPEEIISKSIKSIQETLQWAKKASIEISAICFSNAVSSLISLDEHYNPKSPVFTYADSRAHKEAEIIKEKFQSAQFNNCACPIHAIYWLPKFIWLKNNYSELFNSNYFCTLKDLLIYRITGSFITDQSNAVATGMSNVNTKDWDDALLDIAGINRTQLPITKPTTHVLTTKEGLLPVGIPIVLGATDGVLSSLGAGAYKPGQVTTMIGSSGACRIAADTPLVNDEENVIWSYPLDEEIWIRGGAMNSGGLVTKWAANHFYGEFEPDPDLQLVLLNSDAENSVAGADGLLFLPYLYGERAPIWNEHARGTFFGIHSGHHRKHFARAVLEGILHALYSIFTIIQEDNKRSIEIRATGGYLKSPLMLQIQADMFGYPVGIPKNLEGSSIGAAMLAAKAIGGIQSYADFDEHLSVVDSVAPDVERHNFYNENQKRFENLYKHLAPLMYIAGGNEKT
ncbi:MAG: gluconokinase [Chloroflexota bacterium]